MQDQSAPELPLKLVFDATHRVWRVRLLMWFSLVWGAGCFWAAHGIFFHVGVEGEMVTLVERYALTLLVVAVGLTFPISMAVYAHCYVAKIEVTKNSNLKCYYTLRWLGLQSNLLREDDHGQLTYHEGKFSMRDMTRQVSAPRVDAPYLTQRSRNRRLPFIIDAQGTFL
jgi:hypothetical protein